MPTLVGNLPEPGSVPIEPCRWCGAPTDLRFEPQQGSGIGPVPLHMLCGAGFIRAFERLKAGRVLAAREAERMRRFAGMPAQLGPGHEPTARVAESVRRASTSR